MMLKPLIFLAAALSLGACASQPASTTATPASTDIIAKLQTVTVNDLNDAEADAVAANDAIAMPCYPALAGWIGGLKSPIATPPAGAGVFYAQQKLRDVNTASTSFSIPVSVKLACAALFVDDATFVAKADAFIAAAVASGGATAIPALPLPVSLTPAGVSVTAPIP